MDERLTLARYPEAAPARGDIDSELTKRAVERAGELDYGDFRDAVLPFIDDAVRPFYATPVAWSDMQGRVAAHLLELL